MIRALAAFAALCMLGSCGVIGPGQPELEGAINDFYARGAPAGTPDFSDSTIADFEGCRPANSLYRCPVTFQTSVGHVAALVVAARDDQGWRVQSIVLNRRPPTR